jgi:hypothetical protein
MAHNHYDEATLAIGGYVKAKFPSRYPGWALLIPSKGFGADGPGWLGISGEMIAEYRLQIAPCQCPDASHYIAYKDEPLYKFRDKLLADTTCV